MSPTSEAVVANGRAAGDGRERRLRLPSAAEIISRYGLLVALLAVVVVFSVLRPETFFTTANLQTILGSQAVLLIVTIGLLLPLTAGEFDLSIAGTVTVSNVLIGYLNVTQGWPILAAVVAALLAGVLIGALNAFLVVFVDVQSFVATLGVGTLLLGAALAINNIAIGGISHSLVSVTTTQILGVQLVFYYGLALVLLVWFVLQYMPLGRYLFFVGSGRDVARLSGIRVDRIRAGALIASSLVAALGGVLLAGVLGSSDPNSGGNYLLPAFAGAFLGATAVSPGRFNAWGSFIAIYFLVTGISGLQLLGLSGWIEQVFYGASLVVAVSLSRLAERRRAPRLAAAGVDSESNANGGTRKPAKEESQ
ncbi:MAG TPA: ABC transporter permease [Solirubrobacterales bacterium]|nr:ABC transporter permease [Solirubrobacterales bacterium]